MSGNGYILLYRTLLNHPVFKNEKLFKVWIWCLLKATHAPYDQLSGLRIVHLEPGQFMTGRLTASQELSMKQSTVWGYLKALEKLEMISIKSDNKFSVVTVDNWASYQIQKTDFDNKPTTNRQQTDTNNTHNKQEINIYAQKFDQFYAAYPKKIAKQSAIKAWQKLKPDDDLMTKIMQGLERWKKSNDWLKENGQYIPYPATWINQRRWEDEIGGEVKAKKYVN